MALDADEVRVAPGGTFHIAPVGTAAPASEAAAFVGWDESGYLNEDGITFRDGVTKEKIKAWQSRHAIRTINGEAETQIDLALLQWNKNTMKLAHGGGTVTEPSAGHYKYAPPADDAGPDERTAAVTWEDGGYTYRLIFVKLILADSVETKLVRAAAAEFPLTFDVLHADAGDPWYLLTDDPAFDPTP